MPLAEERTPIMPIRLNQRQLEAFRAVIDTGSVTEAAKRIHVTQPAASRLISDLEHAVGFSLFTRDRKRLEPTPEAMALFEEVDRSFIGLAQIAEAAAEIRAFRRGALLIAGMPALALGFLPKVIAEFSAERPEISVSLQIRSSQKVLQCMASQQFDLGFAAPDSTHPAVRNELLYEPPMVVILPPRHRLCAKPLLEPADFEGEAFVSLGPEHGARARIDAAFTAAGVPRRSIIDTQLSASACQLVANGAGVALIEPVTAADFAKLGVITVRPFLPEISYTYWTLHPAHRPLSRVAETFLDLVRKRIEMFAATPADES